MNLHAIDSGRIVADQCRTGRNRGRARIDENEVSPGRQTVRLVRYQTLVGK
jgi:hypothetical protein